MVKLQPFLKAIAPSVLGLMGALVNWFVTGTFDRASVGSLVLGLVTAVVVYFVPNAQPAVKRAVVVRPVPVRLPPEDPPKPAA